MVRYLRLWYRFVVIALVHQIEYRVSFLVNILVSLLSLGLAILTYDILYSYTDNVAGWSQAEVLMVLGIFRMVEALIEVLIARNMWSITNYLREGEMDYLLVRPASSQFMATLRHVNLAEITNVVIGLGLLIYAGTLAGVAWRPTEIAAAIVFGVSGFMLLYAVWCAAVTCGFWFQGGPLDTVLHWFLDTGRYPVTFFKGWVRLFFTFILPLAFASTFPAQALRGDVDGGLLLLGVVLACLALVSANRFWNYGVRHYSSASS